MTSVRLEPADLARRIIDLFSERQAGDVVLLDLRQVASFTDYFIIASGQNLRHIRALQDAVDVDLAKEGIKALHTEGTIESGWLLIDFGDVIVHIFSPEERAYYNLEALWGRPGVPAVRFQ